MEALIIFRSSALKRMEIPGAFALRFGILGLPTLFFIF
jgi:hypothetical protein